MIASLSESFAEAIATDGLWVLVAAVLVAGLVRGFSGFGTAMIYMPFAATVLSPLWALLTIVVFDLLGPLPNVPRAIKDSTPKDVLRLTFGASLLLPVGLFVLYQIDPTPFRWLVSLTTLTLLVLLVSGWRYHGVLTRSMVYATGALGGFLGGASGLAGPPVIMLYMTSRQPIRAIRANIMLYLLLIDILVMLAITISGKMAPEPLVIGLLLVIPYMLANILGGFLFRPDREKTYRAIAYMLIAGAALANLPLIG